MTRIASLLLLIVFIKPSLEAQSTRNNWAAVEQLPLGQRIEVIEQNGNYPAFCRIDLTDDTTLSCISSAPNSQPERMAFPVANIAALYSIEPSGRFDRILALITAAIGATMGGLEGAKDSPKGATIGATAGALIFGSIALQPSPIPPDIRRRLIYRAP